MLVLHVGVTLQLNQAFLHYGWQQPVNVHAHPYQQPGCDDVQSIALRILLQGVEQVVVASIHDLVDVVDELLRFGLELCLELVTYIKKKK